MTMTMTDDKTMHEMRPPVKPINGVDNKSIALIAGRKEKPILHTRVGNKKKTKKNGI